MLDRALTRELQGMELRLTGLVIWATHLSLWWVGLIFLFAGVLVSDSARWSKKKAEK